MIKVVEVPEWSSYTKQDMASLNIKRNYAKWNQQNRLPLGFVYLCKQDSCGIEEETIAGAFVHELGHAYQTALNPEDVNPIELVMGSN